MKDTSAKRIRIDVLRNELLACWAAPVFDIDLANSITEELRIAIALPSKPPRKEKPVPISTAMIYPHQDDVARLVVAACRETRADPIALVTGNRPAGDQAARADISHARAYAALAIERLFPNCPGAAIARMLGAGSPQVYLSSLRLLEKTGRLKWFDARAFARVMSSAPSDEPDELPAFLPNRLVPEGLAELNDVIEKRREALP